MSYVAIWLQACLHWRCAYFQTLSWNDTIFVVDWDILYKLCGSENKCSKGFVFSGKIWWQFFSCNKACSKYHTCSTTTPKYTLTQRLVVFVFTSQTRLLPCQYIDVSSPIFPHHPPPQTLFSPQACGARAPHTKYLVCFYGFLTEWGEMTILKN